jgi:hypothetical protein
VCSSDLGWWGYADTSTAGMMAAVSGLLFLGVLGGTLLRRAVHRLALSLRIAGEDVLGVLYRLEELRAPSLDKKLLHQIIGNRLLEWLALVDLRRRDLIQVNALTDAGRAAGRSLIRSHRLWESYLAKHLGLPADHLHATSERLEHVTSPAMQAHLAERSDKPQRDPHGREIPSDDQSMNTGK